MDNDLSIQELFLIIGAKECRIALLEKQLASIQKELVFVKQKLEVELANHKE